MVVMGKEGEVVKVLAVSTDKFGRPSKLTPEIVEKAWEYIANTTSVAVNAGGLLPTKERLGLTLKVSRETLYKWAESNEDFSDILATIDQMQADMLLQNSLVGRYNPTIAKLILSKHGYVEKTEQDQNVKLVQPILGGSSVKKKEESDDDNQTD